MPTLADISGTKAPKNIDGISFAPTLFGRGNEQKKHEYLYWEFRAYGGQQAVRLGDWKGVRQNLMRRKKGADPMKIQLYNLANDIGESKDVAADNPKIAARIRQIMKDGRTPSKLFAFPLLDQQ
jgi:arylsulfatase